MAKKGRIERNERIKRTVQSQSKKRQLITERRNKLFANYSNMIVELGIEKMKRTAIQEMKEHRKIIRTGLIKIKSLIANPSDGVEKEISGLVKKMKIESGEESSLIEITTRVSSSEDRANLIDSLEKLAKFDRFEALLKEETLDQGMRQSRKQALSRLISDAKMESKKFQSLSNLMEKINSAEEKEIEIMQKARKELFPISVVFQKLKRDGSAVRVRNRCAVTGRPRAYSRFFGLSRNVIRETASFGMLMGVTKSSW
jgi:small subunit ribosomal protein S14